MDTSLLLGRPFWLAATPRVRKGAYLAALLAASFGAHAQQRTNLVGVPQPGSVIAASRAAAPIVKATPVPQALTATTWTSVAPLSQARSQHAALALGGKIYAWGGYFGGTSTPTTLNSLEIYNPATNAWSNGAAAPEVMRGQAAAVGNDGFIYNFGGAGNFNVIGNSYRYDPAANTWSPLASMPVAEWEARAATANDGRIFVFGGATDESLTQVYNPTTNTWTTAASIPQPRHGAVVVKDAAGLLHLIGGISGFGSAALASHLVYNPTTNTWTSAAPLPQALNQAGGTVGSDGKIYVVGGKQDYYNNVPPFYSVVYIYSPTTNTWDQGTNLPTLLGETAAVSIGSSIYTIAGTNGTQQSSVYRTDLVAPCNPTANTPVANPDSFTATCGPITVTAAQLLANDTSPNGAALAIGSVSGGTNGSVVANANGTYTFTPWSGYTGPATFTYQLQLAGPVFPSTATGHYYELVSAPGICWDAAKTAAAARTYNGLTGYLATLTSVAEINAVKGRSSANYWFGAADDVTEGTWMWKTGPEAGTTFYTNGATVAGQYSNWSLGEPSDFKNQWRPQGEDYASLYGQSGLWNDLDQCGTSGDVVGYVVEYGGLETCTPVLYATGTVTINVTNTGGGAPSVVANADAFSTTAGTAVTVTAAQLLANDMGPINGAALAIGGVSGGANGAVVDNGNGTYTFTPSAGYTGPATFTYQLQLAGSVFPSTTTGHYYELVSANGTCWDAARTAAASRIYNGMQGYLATLTSAAEVNAVKGRSSANYWFGAADDVTEGTWMWKTGPEAGTTFYTNGATVAGRYSNWSPGQPDDFKNQFRPAGEDYAMMYGQSGLWNDMDQCGTSGNITGYVVEYGGLEACTPVLYATGTVTVNVGGTTARGVAAGTKADAQNILEAFPNPNSGQFRVRVVASTEGPAQLELFDLKGQRISSLFSGSMQAGEQREVPVNVAELSTGLYMVRLQTNQHVQYVRVSVQK